MCSGGNSWLLLPLSFFADIRAVAAAVGGCLMRDRISQLFVAQIVGRIFISLVYRGLGGSEEFSFWASVLYR